MESSSELLPRYRATARRGHAEPELVLKAARDDRIPGEEIANLSATYAEDHGWTPPAGGTRDFVIGHALTAGWRPERIAETFGVTPVTVESARERLDALTRARYASESRPRAF